LTPSAQTRTRVRASVDAALETREKFVDLIKGMVTEVPVSGPHGMAEVELRFEPGRRDNRNPLRGKPFGHAWNPILHTSLNMLETGVFEQFP
jgi:hypothetical protein